MTHDFATFIKSALSMPDVARQYGYDPNRAGFAKCPFHGNGTERTGSMKIYQGERGWHCFGCGRGGSVIDFVMLLFHCDFKAACARLNADFHLGIDLHAPVDTDALRAHRAAQERKKRDKAERDAQERALCDEYRRLWRAKMDKAPVWDGTGEPPELDDEFVEALKRLDYLDYLFEVMANERRDIG